MSGDGIDFLLSGPVEPASLRAALARRLSLPETSVQIIGDIGEITDAPVIAQLDELDGDFPVGVALFVRGETPAELVGAVSRALGLRALVTDESPNPFTWRLVHPDGRVEPVTVDPEALDRGEFQLAPADGVTRLGHSSPRIDDKMRAEGLEPPRLAAPAPKAGVSTNSTTPARAHHGTSRLRPHVLVQQRDARAVRDRDVALVGLRPAQAELLARRAEQPADVRGHVREEPARILVLGDAPARQLGLEAVDGAAPVGVQQPAQELPRVLLDDRAAASPRARSAARACGRGRAAGTPRTSRASRTRCGRSCGSRCGRSADVRPHGWRGSLARQSSMISGYARSQRSRAGSAAVSRGTRRRGTTQEVRIRRIVRRLPRHEHMFARRVGRNRLQWPAPGGLV